MASWSDFQFWEEPSINEEGNCYLLFQNRIRLGTGILRVAHKRTNTTVQENFLLETIVQMGFRKEDILQANPNPSDLLEICSELKKFGFSIRLQELLEENFSGSKFPTGLYFTRRGIKDQQK